MTYFGQKCDLVFCPEYFPLLNIALQFKAIGDILIIILVCFALPRFRCTCVRSWPCCRNQSPFCCLCLSSLVLSSVLRLWISCTNRFWVFFSQKQLFRKFPFFFLHYLSKTSRIKIWHRICGDRFELFQGSSIFCAITSTSKTSHCNMHLSSLSG